MALGIVLLAFVLRLLHVLWMRESPYFDAPIMDMLYHVEWARAFAAGETYQEGAFFRAPLYPWLLGAVMTVFGDGLLVPRLLQAGLGALSAYLTYRLGRRVFGGAAGLIASFLVATSWVLVHFDGMLLLPTLLVPLNLAALLVSARLRDEDAGPKYAGLAGLLWGLSAIARPNVLAFMPVLALWIFWGRGKRGAALVLATAAGAWVPVLPITLHNVSVGEPALISTQGGVNFWIGNNPSSDGSSAIVPGTRGGWWEGFQDSIDLAEAAEGRELKYTEVSAHYTDKALDWMGENPGDALAHLGWKTRLLWLDRELSNNLPVRFFATEYDPLLRFSPVGFSWLAAFGVAGLVFALVQKRQRALPLALFFFVYAGTIVAFFVCARFRVPLLPILAIFSGHALHLGYGFVKQREWKSLAALALLAALSFVPTRLTPESIIDERASGHLALGRVAVGEERFVDAEHHLTQALEYHPRNTLAAATLSDVHRALGNFDQAVLTAELHLEWVTRSRREEGVRVHGEVELWTVLTNALLERDGPAACVNYLRQARAKDPGACTYEMEAQVLELNGQEDAAERVREEGRAAGC